MTTTEPAQACTHPRELVVTGDAGNRQCVECGVTLVNTNRISMTRNLNPTHDRGPVDAVHLHATHTPHGWTGDGCPTVCGHPCSTVDTAYRNLDPERVTCERCLAHAS